MHAASDIHYLRGWFEGDSEDCFRHLVERYTGLVYSTAKRTCADESMAREACQLTFITLARKAPSLLQRDSLGGWLHMTAMMQARNLVQFRKREAAKIERMEACLEVPSHHLPSGVWGVLEPMLDDALASLSDRDREAILLRHFRSLSVREIASTLAISVDAAQKRLDRSMTRLRGYFDRHGVATGGSLGTLLVIGFASDARAGAELCLAFSHQALKAAPAVGRAFFDGVFAMLFRRKMALAGIALVAGWAIFASRDDPGGARASLASIPHGSHASMAPDGKGSSGPAARSGAGRQKELVAMYGAPRVRQATSIAEKIIRISESTRELMLSELIPGMESNRLMPKTAKLDPSLNLTDEQRRRLGKLTAESVKREILATKSVLERTRHNLLPVVEMLLVSDECSRGLLPLEEYEDRRQELYEDLVTLENPVRAADLQVLQIGTMGSLPFDDEIFMEDLRQLLTSAQLERFMQATANRMDERKENATRRGIYTDFASMPPITMSRLAKQVQGSLDVLDAMSENFARSREIASQR